MSNLEKNFVHLHVHTEFSLLDGSGKVKKVVARAKELGMNSIAITDHGAMYGCVDFYRAAKDEGIKPIIGCEVYVAGESLDLKTNDRGNETYHLVLLVKNEKGYENLMEIVSKASIDGFYYKPRVDHEYLRSHSEGIIALSACLGGEVQKHILNGNMERAKETALMYKEMFKDGFYLELQYHGMTEQLKVNNEIVKLSKELDIPLVATNDVHYIKQEDSKPHDVLLCIQTAKTVDEENRMKYPSDQFYLKSPEEMYEQFSYIPEALENTCKIADMCNFDYEFHVSKLPKFPLPEGRGAYEYLRELCYKGFIEKHELFRQFKALDFDLENILVKSKEDKELKEYVDRLEYELGVINQMGYVDYFLIVWDFIRFANENGIPTGPGRGSGAGSIVAYTLGITKIDSIKYNLLFERFLNPERISMPDIDSDFCYERRQEVIDYTVNKYGKDNVSQIITFGTMAARACIRDVGRAMNYSYAEVDKIAKMIPTVLGITIEKALDMNAELKAEYNDDERVRDLIDIAKSLEGLPRHTSTHAAGVVISSKPLVNYVPLQQNEGMIVSQFPMGTLEELGLLKMDFLGLRTLTVMNDTVQLIKQNRGIEVDLDKIDFDDKEVYKMIGEGKTVGVFQLESAGMTSFMKELKPDTLEDIIAGISLYRPGPMAEIPRYIRNKKSPEDIAYETPQLEDILGVTYGCMVYQEQVMQIVRDLAGYSMGRSDLVRRAMSKKKHKVMEEERRNFIYGIVDEEGNIEVPGCIKNGITEAAANKIFDQMMDFASYAFNKSHAAAYAVIGYQTAFLMKYYPVEYIAAMLNSVMGINEKVAYYIRCASELNIQVIPPRINESYAKFTVKGDTIIFGMAAIKNVGMNVIESIVESRNAKGNFKDLSDFCNKIDTSAINKRAVESLIKAGAFESFGVYRSQLLGVYEKILDSVNNNKKKNIDGQMNLFSIFEEHFEDMEVSYPNIKEFEKKYILAMEKEMTGLYLSGHPLDEYEETLKNQTSAKISDIVSEEVLEENIDEAASLSENVDKFKDGQKVIIGGIISEVSRKVTKNNTMMAFMRVSDLYGGIEVVVFPKTFDKCRSMVEEDALVLVTGRVSIREEEQPKILCEDIKPLFKLSTEKVYIQVEDNVSAKLTLEEMKPFFRDFKGNTPVYICTKKERKKYMVDRDYWIDTDVEVISFLRKKFGDDNVKIL